MLGNTREQSFSNRNVTWTLQNPEFPSRLCGEKLNICPRKSEICLVKLARDLTRFLGPQKVVEERKSPYFREI